MRVHMCAHACGGERWTLSVFVSSYTLSYVTVSLIKPSACWPSILWVLVLWAQCSLSGHFTHRVAFPTPLSASLVVCGCSWNDPSSLLIVICFKLLVLSEIYQSKVLLCVNSAVQQFFILFSWNELKSHAVAQVVPKLMIVLLPWSAMLWVPSWAITFSLRASCF